MAARLVVLVSGAGTNLQALLDACADPAYGARVVAVGADRDGIEGLARAERAGVPVFVHRVQGFADRAGWDRALTATVGGYQPDLVISAGFMRLVGPQFLAAFAGRFINSHPALLPSFPGMHGPRDALAYGVKVTGVTIFMVDSGVDTGPVITQAAVPVQDTDDEATLHDRIKGVERVLLVDTVGRMVRQGYHTEGRRVLIHEPTASGQRSGRGAGAQPARETQRRTGGTVKRPIRRALVSVYDKTGLVELGRGLAEAGVQMVSTGSTAGVLRAAGVAVLGVEELTGFGECLDGRVKTLHPRVHAGLLADTRNPGHLAELEALDIAPFDLVVSNLYPFRQAVTAGGVGDEVVEQIDIGGPAMVRAAAKNHASVAVVVDPAGYPEVLAAVRSGGFELADRKRLAAAAFAHTAAYDVAVARWFASELVSAEPTGPGASCWPGFTGVALDRTAVLRYGENPHQAAALYVEPGAAPGLAQAEKLHGKAMSYNNYVDADAAWRAVHDFAEPCVAIIKHANPCGIALGADVAEAHRKAHECDPTSAFGGVIATNRPVSAGLARQVAEVFTEVLVAPAYEEGALEVLRQRKNIRLLLAPAWAPAGVELRQVSGGALAQTADRVDQPGDDPAGWLLVAGTAADPATLADLAFAWRAVRAVKSNAILLAADRATVGVGMGQVNRVDAARLAVARAGRRAAGSVAASDAFFPFPDGLAVLVEGGVRAVVQPGGSVRDEEVVAAAKEAGIVMYLTGTRHFSH